MEGRSVFFHSFFTFATNFAQVERAHRFFRVKEGVLVESTRQGRQVGLRTCERTNLRWAMAVPGTRGRA